MNRYSIFQALILSFFSKDLYRDVATNWGAKTFLYLLFLVTICCIPLTVLLQKTINHNYALSSDKIVAQLPMITLKNGKFTTTENRPYIVKNNNHEAILIIDTSGHYKEIKKTRAGVLITNNTIITHTNPTEIHTYNLPKRLSLAINPQVANDYIKSFISYAWIFLFILLIIISYVYRILQALFYALIGKLLSKLINVSLAYTQIVVIAMVAITPALILYSIFELLGIDFNFESFWFFLLAMFYLMYGMLANKKQE